MCRESQGFAKQESFGMYPEPKRNPLQNRNPLSMSIIALEF
jgi:hypothetical protein